MRDDGTIRTQDSQRQCIEEGFCRPKHKAKKNKLRWCRGKEGVEHRWLWTSRPLWPGHITRAARVVHQSPFCAECGKWRHDYRRLCLICGHPSNHKDFGSDGSWWGGSCPVCYLEWYPGSRR